MQDMRSSKEALGERAASGVRRIVGKAICCNCESQAFQIVIYNDGAYDIACANKNCGTVWEAIGQRPGQITRISQAMDN